MPLHAPVGSTTDGELVGAGDVRGSGAEVGVGPGEDVSVTMKPAADIDPSAMNLTRAVVEEMRKSGGRLVPEYVANNAPWWQTGSHNRAIHHTVTTYW